MIYLLLREINGNATAAVRIGNELGPNIFSTPFSDSETQPTSCASVCNQQRHKTRRSDIAKYFHTGVRKNTRQDQGQGGRGEDKRNKD